MAKKNKRPIERKPAVAASAAPVEFNPDYTHTKKDLARIGTLAGFFVVALVALSFFLK
ncbi:MAG: hypothetical protein PHQ36_06560 [Anaerolineales bacterium]|nr:hypothetical protein [Anaerolineales bacterium]